MITRFIMAAAAAAVLTAGTPAFARDAEGVTSLVAAPAALGAQNGYILFESSRAKSGVMKITHVFLRVPSDQELAAYRAAKQEAYDEELPRLQRRARGGAVPTLEEFEFSRDGGENVFAVDMGESLGISDWFLLEVPPGTYILYGVAINSRMLASCNCLGTVQFDVAPGVITHLGGLYADKSHSDSPVPFIEDDLGEQIFQYGWILSQAVVPASEESPAPPELAHLEWQPATYRPVPAFVEPGAAAINRLAPIPGILEYDRGRVVVPSAMGEDLDAAQP